MQKKTIHVCYVVYCEEIWNPLLKRQVLELLQTAANSEERLKVRLLYIFPWYWKYIKKQQFKDFAEEVDAFPLEMRFLPVPFPFPFPYIFPKYIRGLGFRPFEPDSSVFFWVVKWLVLPVLLKYVLIDKIKIFHGRSYPASSILLFAKRVKQNIHLVFDPRSDFPEENLLQSSWTRSSHAFRFWKKEEKELLQLSSTTVCISEFYKRHYHQYCADFKYITIPNNVDCSTFAFSPSAREEVRQAYKLGSKTVFCFLGSMRINGWHCPSVYCKVIKAYRALEQPHVFLFLVAQTSREDIERMFAENGIGKTEYLIISPAFGAVPTFLSAADFGLIYLEREKIALGTKVVEYNAVGLPVLVNSNVLSAAGYVKEHQTGLVIDIGLGGLDKKKTALENIDFAALGAASKRAEIAQTAVSLFSNQKIASEYVQLYKSFVD